MIIGETSNPGDLSSEIELRITLGESGLSLPAGGDIGNAGDPANDVAVGISIRDVHDAENGTFRAPVKGNHAFVLDALARKHAFNVGTDGGKCGFTHHFDDRPSDNNIERQT